MKKLLFMTASVLGLALASGAQATIIDTFHVSQGGWVGDYDGTLDGTFSVVENSSGEFGLQDLTSFKVTFSAYLGPWSWSAPTLFDYEPSGGASTLYFQTEFTQEGGMLCVGFAAALGDCGNYLRATNVTGMDGVLQMYTHEFPTITLVSSVITDPAPVPGPVVGAGLPGLITACAGVFAWSRRKRTGATTLAA